MALRTAIRHLRHGDWQKAHTQVQDDESELGCFAHGIVHLMEGDVGNARYWYRRARRPFPVDADASAEIDALAAAVDKPSTRSA
jgi:hypothetical protein